MNRKDRIEELEKKIIYIKSILKETQDELFLLKVEENQEKKRGIKPLSTRRLSLKKVALPLVVGSYLNPQLKDNS